MLTVDFDRLGLRPGERVLDMGCGAGRHAFEMYRRGADVVAFDQDADELSGVRDLFAEMLDAGEVPEGAEADVKEGDALSLPFADGEFDRIVAAEVLEHIPADIQAIAELARVLRPGGTIALTVPRWLPEIICWRLSDDYHNVPGGHIRIYTDKELTTKAEAAGLEPTGRGYAHGLHAPYWWLKCAVGVTNDDNPAVKAYHRLLVWDIMKKPRTTRYAERVLDPLIGKSLVLYFRKPDAAAEPARTLPSVPGVLTAAQVAESAASIEAMQEPDGAIPWTTGAHTDVWNHLESAMGLLAARQAGGGRAGLRLGAGRPSGPTARGR